MGNLGTVKNRECFLFDTFLKCSDFKSAYAEIKDYDSNSETLKIIPAKKENNTEKKDVKSHEKKYEDAYKLVYDTFKKVEKSMTRKGETPDFGNRETLKKMFSKIKSELQKMYNVPLTDINKDANIGAGMAKFYIGSIMIQCTDYVSRGIGKIKEKRHHTPLAEGPSHGIVSHGSYGDGEVFSSGKTYKSNAQIIKERIQNEA